jgi:hypothetical protein
MKFERESKVLPVKFTNRKVNEIIKKAKNKDPTAAETALINLIIN